MKSLSFEFALGCLVPQDWPDWAAFAQVLQTVFVILALVYAKRQVDEAKKQREVAQKDLAESRKAGKLQVAVALIGELADKELRECRDWVMDQMPRLPAEMTTSLSHDDELKARRVAVSLDRVGFMLKQKLIDEDALFDAIVPAIVEKRLVERFITRLSSRVQVGSAFEGRF